MKNKRAGNRFGKTYIHFDGWPTLGKTGMSLEPNDKNGFRLGFVQINDGGIAVYAKKGKTPILRLGWADFIKKCASIAAVLVTVAMVGCADPAFQQYIQSRQAAIAAMPNSPAKFYEQARLDEQILADKREQQQRAAAAAAIFAAGMANAGAIYAQRAQTPIVYPIIQHNTLGTPLNPLVIRSAGY
jgi:hypothetical protein